MEIELLYICFISVIRNSKLCDNYFEQQQGCRFGTGNSSLGWFVDPYIQMRKTGLKVNLQKQMGNILFEVYDHYGWSTMVSMTFNL